MISTTSKRISALLAVLMLAQLIPSNLIGQLATKVQAEDVEDYDTYTDYEDERLIDDYIYEIPYESENSVEVEIPPTYIYEDENDTEDIQESETDSESGKTETEFDYPLPELSEEDERLIGIISEFESYSMLSESDAEFLCSHTGISDADFQYMEEHGAKLSLSISYGKLAGLYLCPVSSITGLSPDEDQYSELIIKIHEYTSQINSDFTGSETDIELRAYLLRGYTCDEVFLLYGLSRVNNTTIEDIVDISSGDIASLVYEYNTDEVDEAIAEITKSVNSSGDTGGSETVDYPKINNPIESPFMYNAAANEKVELSSGSLVYETTDYVLPGVNGLDLVIGRRYNSQEANESKVRIESKTIYHYYIELGANIYHYYYDNMHGYYTEVYVGCVTYEEVYDSKEEADNRIKEWKQQYPFSYVYTDEQTHVGRILHVKEFSGHIEYKLYAGKEYSANAYTNNYANAMWGLGYGWEFCFSSIEDNYNEGMYLHLSTGEVYEIDFNSANDSNLKDYPLSDKKVEQDRGSFSNGYKTSSYKLTYSDGTVEYFDYSGKLIGIQNRYGNTIKFIHNTVRQSYISRPQITIIDTLDREITLEPVLEDGLINMVLTLPDNVTLTYATVGGYISMLSSYTDASGEETHYSYTVQSANCDPFNKELYGEKSRNIGYYNLTTITHPTGAQSVFTYAKDLRNYGQSGLTEVFKINSREDIVNGEVYNKLVYSYSDNDSSGYPQCSNPNSLYYGFKHHTCVTNTSTGIRTKYIFNKDHLCENIEVSYDGMRLQAIETKYDSYKLPYLKTIQTFSDNNQSYPLTITERYAYNKFGNVSSSFSSLADGDIENVEYRTDYTYDETYSILLNKTYKTDSATTVKIVNTLTEDKKNIATSQTYVNETLTSQTDYAYDTYGNVISVKEYHDNFTDYDLTEYEYANNAYLTKEIHSGVYKSDGNPAVSTEGELAGTIASVYSYDILGRLISKTDPSGNTYSYEYDNLGNLIIAVNPDDTEVRYYRDYQNNTLTVTDENGNRVKYTYTPLGLEFETVDVESGKVLTRKEYDDSSRLVKVSEYVYGGVTTYTYDPLGRVTSENKYQGYKRLSRIVTSYDDAYERGTYQQIIQTVVGETGSPSIKTTKYTDKHGNTVKEGYYIDGVEYFNTNTYDYAGRVITSLTAADSEKGLDYTAKYEYNEKGQVTRTYNAQGDYVENIYNSLGQLTASSDYAGTETTYSYDSLGRLIEQTQPIDYSVSASSKYEYDANGNIIVEWKPINAVGEAKEWSKTEYSYDSRNRLISAVQYEGDSPCMTTGYTYDNAGNTLTVTVGDEYTASYTYDRFGNVLTMTDSAGESETYSYTELGRLEKKTDRNGAVIQYKYDALGRNTLTYSVYNAELSVQYASYYQTGALKESASESQLTQYTYNDLGQVIQVTESECEFDASNIPGCYRVTLDPNGGEVAVSEAFVIRGERYDLPVPTRQYHTFVGWKYGNKLINNGDIVTVTSDCVLTAEWESNIYIVMLDANGGKVSPNIVKVTEGGVYLLPEPTRRNYEFIGWQYNGEIIKNGDIIKIKEDCRFVAQWKFMGDAESEYTITLDANGGVVARNEITVVNGDRYQLPIPLNEECIFAGWFNTDTRELVVNGDTIELTSDCKFKAEWDEADINTDFSIIYNNTDGVITEQKIQICHANQPVTLAENCFSYKNNGFDLDDLFKYEFKGWSTTPYGNVEYTDGQSDVELAALPGASVHLYAVWSRKGGDVAMMSLALYVSEEFSYVKTYEYDLAGNVTEFTVTEGDEVIQSVSYTYDNLNRLSTVSENGIQRAEYTYDRNGNRESLTYDNGITVLYAYNRANWITRLYTRNGSTLISSYSYTYYTNGSIKDETDANGIKTSYVYDELNRLVEEEKTQNSAVLQTISYTYDEYGNRSQQRVRGEDERTTVYTYDENNRLMMETTNTPEGISITVYEYDANGNTVSKVCGEERFDYTYDALGKLKTYTTNESTAHYEYNANGIRTSKSIDGNTVRYYLNGSDVIGEVCGRVAVTYLRGINLICTDEYYYVYDAHGDVVKLTDADGNTIKSYEYDAFGVEKNPDEDDTNPFRYCGEYWDSETETYYLRARYYDPTIGRFTQQDTHWNVANMIYGDNPQKINERQDKLGLTSYSYVPQIYAVMQSDNLYAYAVNNPIYYIDKSGNIVTPANIIGALVGAGSGALLGVTVAEHYGLSGWKNGLTIAGFAVGGAVIGWFAGPLVEEVAMEVAVKMEVATATAGSGAAMLSSTESKAPSGQYHHVLSNPIMRAINNHPTLSGLFDRAKSVIQALTQEAHRGYQQWHRFIDNEMVNWINDPINKDATAEKFWEKLYELYNTPEMIERFGESVLEYIRSMMK